MTNELRTFVTEKVKEAMAAPSCCPELKEMGQKWLDAAGTEREGDLTKALIQELEEDVCTIDDVLAFFGSPAGAAAFGEEGAKALVEQGKAHKAAGNAYCFCPACTAGSAILARKAELV